MRLRRALFSAAISLALGCAVHIGGEQAASWRAADAHARAQSAGSGGGAWPLLNCSSTRAGRPRATPAAA
eukprot:915459-Pleurochrysis_carterae.AAC.2